MAMNLSNELLPKVSAHHILQVTDLPEESSQELLTIKIEKIPKF
jgi:hypothetical protein